MFELKKKINGLNNYLIGGYKILSNWPTFFLELLRVKSGLKTKCTLYKLRDGTKLRVHANSTGLNFVFYEVFLKRVYDNLPEFTLKNDDIIVDIGAHLGFFTIKASKIASQGTVYSFEPFSKHYKILKENIEQNGIKNVKYYNEAIYDKTGELNFYYTLEGDPTNTSIFKINIENNVYNEKINSISLSDFFLRERITKCNFMKIDCEGAEYSILMNTDDTTLDKIQKIAMEWHRFSDEHDPKKLSNFLKEKGFQVIEPQDYNKTTGLLFAYR